MDTGCARRTGAEWTPERTTRRIHPDTSFMCGSCAVFTSWLGGDPFGTVQLLARVLYVTDYVDIMFSRQLPLHHPRLHPMMIHSEYWPIFNETTLGLATQTDWIPVPTSILLQPGPPTVREVPFVYDLVVVGLVASPDLRNELGKQTNVDVAEEEMRVRVLPARTCFPNGVIEVHGQGIRFQLPEPPEAAVAGSALR